MPFLRFGIRAKLTLGFGLQIALVVIVAAGGLLGLRAVQNSYESAIEQGLNVKELARELEAELQRARRAEADFLLRYKGEGFDAANRKYVPVNQKHVTRIHQVIARLEAAQAAGRSATARRIDDDLVALKPYVNVYADDFVAAIGLIRRGAPQAQVDVKIGEFRAAAIVVEPLVADIVSSGERHAAEAIAAAKAASYRTVLVVSMSLVIAILTGLLLAYVLSRQITAPLQRLARTAEAIGSGDFNALARVSSGDEIGMLAGTFNTMTGRFRYLVASLEQRVLERKQVEAALVEAKQRLELALDGSSAAIWDIDLRTGEVYLSAGWSALLGEAPGETRTTSKDLIKLVHPDDLDQTVALSVRVLKGELAAYNVEHRVRARNGEWKWIISRGKVIERDAGGRALRMSGTNTDVTERRRADEALRQADERLAKTFRASPIACCIVRLKDGVLLEINDSHTRLHGYSREEAIGRTPVELGFWVDPSKRLPFVEQMRQQGWVHDYEYETRTKSGEIRTVLLSAELVNLQDDPCMIVLDQDITEAQQARKRMERINVELEERVGKRTEELRAAMKELEAFSYSVSHDLRAPLGALSGFAGLLRAKEADRLSDEGRKLLGFVEHNAVRMTDLVDGLLALSRIGQQKIANAQVQMQELVNELLAESPGAAQAEIRLEVLPECHGDALLLRQVWANLLGNALKYSRGRNPARIDIGFDAEPRAYFVRDNGAGFDMRYADKLFGAFERLHSESEFEGTGVGLAIASRIVQRHGGRIWAQSAPGQGATFWFTMPQ